MSPIQSLEVIGFAPETTFGTKVTPTKFVPGIPNVNTNTKLARPAQARGTRGQVIDAIVGVETGVTITAELIPEVLSSLVAGWFGTGCDTPSGSAGTGITHTMVPKNALPSFTVEVDTDIFNQTLARQLVGCMVDQVTLRATNQQLATMECQLIGQRETTPATPGQPSNPTPAITTIQPFDFSLLASTYKSASTTQLMDMTLTMMNHVQRIFTNNGQLYISRLSPTLREVQFSTTIDFLNTIFYQDIMAGLKPATGILLTMTGAVIPSASGNYVIEYALPGVRLNGQYNLSAANDVLQEQVSWSITVNGADEIHSRWVNSETGALA